MIIVITMCRKEFHNEREACYRSCKECDFQVEENDSPFEVIIQHCNPNI
jgi:hypothetical protein